METARSVFNAVCSLCGKRRYPLPTGVLICDDCDFASNEFVKRSVIPNDPRN